MGGRATKETNINVALNLDPERDAKPGVITTGLMTLDALLRELQVTSGVHLEIECAGDLWIDDHHSAEDVMITLGKVLAEALGDKGGVNRMGCAFGQDGESAHVQCVMDLSNRPAFCSDLQLDALGEEMVGDLSVEMMYHCFESFVMNALMTVHVVQIETANQPSANHLALAAARALGAALKECISVDPRRAGATASSKGTLSK